MQMASPRVRTQRSTKNDPMYITIHIHMCIHRCKNNALTAWRADERGAHDGGGKTVRKGALAARGVDVTQSDDQLL